MTAISPRDGTCVAHGGNISAGKKCCKALQVRVEYGQGDNIMSKYTLDAAVCQSLGSLTQPVELCDPSGHVVGKFYPQIDLSEWEPVDPNEPEVTDEELRRRVETEPRYTTAEVLAYLEKL